MDIKHNVEKHGKYTAVIETTDNERKYITTIIDKRKIDSEEERKKGIEINNIFEGEHTNGATWIDTNSIDIDDAIENMKEANEDALREYEEIE